SEDSLTDQAGTLPPEVRSRPALRPLTVQPLPTGDVPKTVTPPPAVSWRVPVTRSRRAGDTAFRLMALGFALSVFAITVLIGTVLWLQAGRARAAFGWSFLWTSTWDPVFLKFGALPFIYGPLASSAIALAVAVPFGLGAAICLAELLPQRLADPLAFLVELL